MIDSKIKTNFNLKTIEEIIKTSINNLFKEGVSLYDYVEIDL